jgi:formate-dependent phosphoribosylglycinamide formyltransferase (GAR transformylase)
MKKIMILGASILQLPAILKAKEMGLQVIAVDIDKNSVGFKHADVCIEISTIDIHRVVEAAKQYRIDGVMTLASDMPMRTVAAVAKELNLVGVSEETALKATNKAVMREKENDEKSNLFWFRGYQSEPGKGGEDLS